MDYLIKLISDYLATFIVTISSLIALAFVAFFTKKIPGLLSEKVWGYITNIWKPHKVELQFNKYSKVADELNMLVDSYGADRGVILEFHNGEYFSSKLPQWKLSQTYQKSKLGVTVEDLNIKSLPVSLVWDIVGPVLSNTMDNPNIHQVNTNMRCGEGCINKTSSYFMEVEKNPSSFSKYFLSRGTQFLLISVIYNSAGLAVGLLILEFLDDNIIHCMKKKDFSVCEICDTCRVITSIQEN